MEASSPVGGQSSKSYVSEVLESVKGKVVPLQAWTGLECG
jgi:hypothetical protein